MNQADQQQTLLNLDMLNAAFMNDLDIIKQILGAYQETITDFEERFKQLENAGDLENLSRLVHGLKGSSANIRAELVASKAARLQQLIDQKADYSEALDPLLSSLNLLEQEIEKIKAQ